MLNINNSKCQRCKTREAVSSCLMCDSFKLLCNQCDNYLHGLPSKKKHKRNLILDKNSFVTTNEPIEESNPNSRGSSPSDIMDWDKKVNMASPTMKEERNNQINFNKTKNGTNNKNNYYSNNQMSNSLSNLENNKTNFNAFGSQSQHLISSIDKENNSNLGYFPTTASNISHFTSYSKDYLNELKNIFEKEKSELVYKNTSLQNNLDRLKANFTDQINTLNLDIEDLNKKHSLNFKSYQDNYEHRMKLIMEEKDNNINNLISRIDELERINRLLTNKVEENLRSIHDLNSELGNKNKQLEDEIFRKNQEYEKIKENFNTNINEVEKRCEDDKRKLIYEYEIKLEKIISQFEDMKNKMSKILDDREHDIKNILERQKEDLESYRSDIDKLRQENEFHKANILSLRNKKENLDDENSNLSELLDKLKKESKFQMAEIRLLDQQNKSFFKDNEELKIQLSKLDKLVYGKIRAPVFKK